MQHFAHYDDEATPDKTRRRQGGLLLLLSMRKETLFWVEYPLKWYSQLYLTTHFGGKSSSLKRLQLCLLDLIPSLSLLSTGPMILYSMRPTSQLFIVALIAWRELINKTVADWHVGVITWGGKWHFTIVWIVALCLRFEECVRFTHMSCKRKCLRRFRD